MSTNGDNLGRIEAAIWADSAIIDRETGRVIWEGGASNTLWESVGPKLNALGAEHLQATIISVVLSLAFLGILAAWIQRFITSKANELSRPPSLQVLSILVWPLLKIPKVENRWLVMAFVLLYVLESYNCSTRRFLSNTISSSEELEKYLEKLRHEAPIVTWNLKTFHYEYRKILMLPRRLGSIIRFKGPSEEGTRDDPSISSTLNYTMKRITRHTSPRPLITRKVVTSDSSAVYQFASCKDDTMVGVWTRAQALENSAPLTKIALTQLLILKDGKSREDYLRQQSNFVSHNGNIDEYSRFSTNFQIANIQPRVLVVRPMHTASKFFRLKVFWALTMLGMTVPYRIWFDRHADFVRVTTIKETCVSPDTKGKGWTMGARSLFPSQTSIPSGNVVGTIFGD